MGRYKAAPLCFKPIMGFNSFFTINILYHRCLMSNSFFRYASLVSTNSSKLASYNQISYYIKHLRINVTKTFNKHKKSLFCVRNNDNKPGEKIIYSINKL